MQKLLRILSSMALMGTIFLILALSMAVATFIENDFGTNAANALVYRSWWFEALFSILAVNLLLNIFNFNLLRKEKIAVLLFHLSFFIILVGAAITRYISFEGTMHIREGESSGQIITMESYLNVEVTDGNSTAKAQKKVLFSELTKKEFNKTLKINGEEITIESVDFVPNATLKPSSFEGGKPLFALVVARNSGREEVFLSEGDKIQIEGVSVGFNALNSTDVTLSVNNSKPFIKSKIPLSFMTMQTQTTTEVEPNKTSDFYSGVLYTAGSLKFVLTSFVASGGLMPVSAPRQMEANFKDAVILKATNKKRETALLNVFGTKGAVGESSSTTLNNLTIKATLGSIPIAIPYSIYLKDFILDRYPGSNSPKSFASEVTLTDGSVKLNKRIFMNNILNYGGYRFYQSSYDVDEKGTVLSVNHDYAGTIITYIGYLILAISLILALIMPNTRFRYLLNQTGKTKHKKEILLMLIVLFSFSFSNAQEINPPHPVSEQSAELFGTLWVQDQTGRTEPLNTLNNEITRKLVKHNSYKGLSADQFILSMLINPEFWQKQPLITITSPELQETLNITANKASFIDFLTPEGGYKLQSLVDNAYRTRASERNKTQQEIIKVDEQINVFYMTQTGGFLKIFPNPQNSQAPWVTPGTTPTQWNKTDSLIVSTLFALYLDAQLKNETQKAQEYLQGIKKFQNEHANSILPSLTHAKVEVIYNNSNIFLWLSVLFFTIGSGLLILQFVTLLIPKYQFKLPIKIIYSITLLFFALQTAGMITRWYLSGHAPWSNGYESMLYIGWSINLVGLIFYHKNDIALSVASLFSGVVLMVAHLSWMNPEITPLVPVLQSYWLTIHVAVIVLSYGFFTIGALLGFINLILIGLKSTKNYLRLQLKIEEITALSEITLIVGLYLLTIGAFLGGVWANESWGRYWGWDPKETWSMITILIYAFIIHARFIPLLKDTKVFNFMAVLGFSSVVMTYLGVNYYLAGMHSYAKGDPVPVPLFVYYSIAVIFTVSFYAFYNDYILNKELVEDSQSK